MTLHIDDLHATLWSSKRRGSETGDRSRINDICRDNCECPRAHQLLRRGDGIVLMANNKDTMIKNINNNYYSDNNNKTYVYVIYIRRVFK